MASCNSKGQTQLPGLDVLKFGMALFVISMHVHLFKEFAWLKYLVAPMKGCAVPVFFVVSSYLYFKKPIGMGSLCHYTKRLSFFYVFWFVTLLPVTVIIRQWYKQFDFVAFARCFFLGSTFRGSYFIMALMVGVPIIQTMRKYLHPLALLFVTFAVHLLFHYQWWIDAPWATHSFLPFLLWITIGALLASSPLSSGGAWSRLFVLFLLYCGMLVPHLHLSPFLRPAFVVTLFSFSLAVPLQPRSVYVTLRKMSILIFVTHFAFADAAHLLATTKFPALDNSLIQYSVVFGSSALISWIILKLQAKPFFGWLKYGM